MILQTAKIPISIITIVEPTGVSVNIETRIPTSAPNTEKTHEATVTLLKLLKISIEDTDGKMMSAEIKSVPTRFIARTITVAMTEARTTFRIFVRVPQANAKSSSNVIAKILL